VAGPISDHLTCISDRGRIIFFASVSQYLMAICFVAMILIPTNERILIQVFFTAVTMFSGLNTVGVTKCIQLASRKFSHVLFSWRTFMNSIVTLLLPLMVNVMAPNETIEQWKRIFVVIAVALVVTTTMFDFYAEVEPRSWAVIPSPPQSNRGSTSSQGDISVIDVETATRF